MKKYVKGIQQDVVQVGLDVVLGDAILELVKSGIDEDSHFFSSTWQEIDDDDLEFALNNSQTMAQVMSYIQLPLIERLREVLAARRQEAKRTIPF